MIGQLIPLLRVVEKPIKVQAASISKVGKFTNNLVVDPRSIIIIFQIRISSQKYFYYVFLENFQQIKINNRCKASQKRQGLCFSPTMLKEQTISLSKRNLTISQLLLNADHFHQNFKIILLTIMREIDRQQMRSIWNQRSKSTTSRYQKRPRWKQQQHEAWGGVVERAWIFRNPIVRCIISDEPCHLDSQKGFD